MHLFHRRHHHQGRFLQYSRNAAALPAVPVAVLVLALLDCLVQEDQNQKEVTWHIPKPTL